MKAFLRFFLSAIIAAFAFLSGCSTEPQPVKDEEQKEPHLWQEVAGFSNISVRYLVKNDNALFISGYDPADKSGYLYKTTDGENWELIKRFPPNKAGLLAFNGDDLYIFSDSLYKYTPDNKLSTVCYFQGINFPMDWMDMVFIHDTLYIAADYFVHGIYKLKFDGTYVELPASPYGYYGWGTSKFIKDPSGNDIVYARPQYYNRQFYTFNGSKLSYCTDGLVESSKDNEIVNSMAFKDGNLYAGFSHPTIVMVYLTNSWFPYTNELPAIDDEDYESETTALTFYGERLFAATNYLGVMEWSANRKWIDLSDGLRHDDVRTALYEPVAHIEYFKGHLFAAYGGVVNSVYFWGDETGVYKADVSKIKQ